MKGVILAGGRGERLYPLTKIIPKCLLPIYDKPMIYYPIFALSDAGVDDLLVVTENYFAEDFINLLGDGRQFGLKNLSFTIQKEPLGIADALRYAYDFAEGQPIAVMLGDNIVEDGIAENVRRFKEQKTGARILLKEVHDPERFGVAELNGNKIIRIVEKPKNPKTNFAVTGIYLYDAYVFDIIKNLKPSKRGEFEITDVNNEYIKKGAMEFDFLSGWWIDAGTFDSLLQATLLVAGKEFVPSLPCKSSRNLSEEALGIQFFKPTEEAFHANL